MQLAAREAAWHRGGPLSFKKSIYMKVLPLCVGQENKPRIRLPDFSAFATFLALNHPSLKKIHNLICDISNHHATMTTPPPTDLSKPYIPVVGHAADGYSKENEATATCFCGTVQLAFVRPLTTQPYIYIRRTPRLILPCPPAPPADLVSRRRVALRVPLPGLPQGDGDHVSIQLHGAGPISKAHPGPRWTEAVVSEPIPSLPLLSPPEAAPSPSSSPLPFSLLTPRTWR